MRYVLGTFFLVSSATAFPQAADKAPTEAPNKATISVMSSTPKFNNGNFSVLFTIKSTSDEAIPIAIRGDHRGIVGYSVTGASCSGGSVSTNDIPLLKSDGSELREGQPGDFTAGAHRVALMPMNFLCRIKKGDEVSYAITIYSMVGRQWLPQQFSWQQQIVE